MAFLRVVEILPPFFPAAGGRTDRIPAGAAMGRFGEEARGVRDFADVLLVADVKDLRRVKFDGVLAAAMLRDDFNLPAAPVIVVRDQNRPQFLSTVLTVVSLGLDGMLIAWGDDFPASSHASNVRDFPDLAKAIREASRIRSRARSLTRLFAPIDVESLAYPKGVALARGRLRAGADFLLAQPPTTDDGETFDRHASLLVRAGLKEKVLPNVFHFTDEGDVRGYEKMFGWRLPRELHQAARGEGGLTELERKVIHRLRAEGFAGVYLSTRGNPSLAERLLS
ncbi:MAG: methylenetetrahydrofolate reductase [Nitrososphaerota archaeon]|nr:methylenetetrahydrofolate reductase [Nitrososphaerota archaeon]MDG7023447.1 methylenetetrahydrofolate reductase [Nitrososphaerota archaeon]